MRGVNSAGESANGDANGCNVDMCQLEVELTYQGSSGETLVGRPWLAMTVDPDSRLICGAWVSMEPPTVKGVYEFLLNSTNGNNEIGEGSYEVPRRLYTDNGCEFTGKQEVQPCTPYMKGRIERIFRLIGQTATDYAPISMLDLQLALENFITIYNAQVGDSPED